MVSLQARQIGPLGHEKLQSKESERNQEPGQSQPPRAAPHSTLHLGLLKGKVLGGAFPLCSMTAQGSRVGSTPGPRRCRSAVRRARAWPIIPQEC